MFLRLGEVFNIFSQKTNVCGAGIEVYINIFRIFVFVSVVAAHWNIFIRHKLSFSAVERLLHEQRKCLFLVWKSFLRCLQHRFNSVTAVQRFSQCCRISPRFLRSSQGFHHSKYNGFLHVCYKCRCSLRSAYIYILLCCIYIFPFSVLRGEKLRFLKRIKWHTKAHPKFTTLNCPFLSKETTFPLVVCFSFLHIYAAFYSGMCLCDATYLCFYK